MPYDLKGRKVLITGASRGLGVAVAERFATEGCDVVISYISSEGTAKSIVKVIQEKYGVKSTCFQCDVGIESDCVTLVNQSVEFLGGLDILVSNAAWTRITDRSDLYSMEDSEWDKCWTTNVKSNLWLFRTAAPTLKANPNGGVFLHTSSIAAKSMSSSSLPYLVTKAAGSQLVRFLAYTQGPKIRVNSILPGLLLTDWGMRFPEDVIKKWIDGTALKQAPEIIECADVYVSLAKNLSMTGQEVTVDCGFLLSHGSS